MKENILIVGGSRKPWRHYQDDKRNSLKYEEIVEKIKDNYIRQPRFSTFLALLYLTGSRIGEVISYIYEGRYAKDVLELQSGPIVHSGIKFKDIMFMRDVSNNYFLIVRTRVEKLSSKLPSDEEATDNQKSISLQERIKGLNRLTYKECIIPLDQDNFSLEFKLFEILDNYWSQEKYYKEFFDSEYMSSVSALKKICPFKEELGEQELFAGLKHNLCWNRITKMFQTSPHGFRMWRTKQLAEIYNFSVTDLMKTMGWKTSDMAAKYSESDETAILQRYKKVRKDD